MSCITRGILRWGLIGGLGLGGVTLLVGPERVAMGLAQIRVKAQHVVESAIDDPVALRRQLEELTEQYPAQIAEVRGEIAEVDHQLSQFEHDIEIAERVVAMTVDDLGSLKALVSRAESRSQLASSGGDVAIRFQGVRFDVNEAYDEARRINEVRDNYKDRMAHDEQQLGFLQQQKDRLAQILTKLESEFGTVENQLWQLDRQIDSIERNERLIVLTEQHEATLDSYDRFGKVANLKQLQGKLAELRTIQEVRLEVLARKSGQTDYETRVRYEIETEDVTADDPFEEVEETEESYDDVAESSSTAKSMAWNGTFIVE